MCGRYTLRRADKAVERLTGARFEWDTRYNVAPSQQMPIVFLRDGSRAAEPVRWGFVPFYERSKPKPQALINARSETVASKPAFKRAAQKQRCLVPADGFFEWQKHAAEKTKTPFFIRLRDDEPLAFAGLWEPAAGEIAAGYLLLTTAPNSLMEPIHNRMPVIVRPEYYEQWLSNVPLEPSDLQSIFAPYPPELMTADAITPLVNSPKNDRPEILSTR